MMETYLVAITPPASIQKTVLAEKRKYPKFSVYHLPPHITLYHAFESEITVQELALRLKEKLHGATHFAICLNDYGVFENKQNVLFLKPNRSSIKLLSAIHNKVKKAIPPTHKEINTPYRTYGAYNPHLTIAQNIPKRELAGIKGQLQKPTKSLTFTCSGIDIYQRNPTQKPTLKSGTCFYKKPTHIKPARRRPSPRLLGWKRKSGY